MGFKYSVFLVKLLQKLPNFWNNFQSADVVLLNVTQINHIFTFQRPSVESKAEEVGFKAEVFAYYQFHEFFFCFYFLYEYFDFSSFFFQVMPLLCSANMEPNGDKAPNWDVISIKNLLIVGFFEKYILQVLNLCFRLKMNKQNIFF